MDDREPLAIFTPSGKRGRVPAGTTVLEAARTLGVDLDSVCGGRGICSKCQCAPLYGTFPKHGVTVAEDALSPINAVETRHDEKRGLKPGRRLGCQARIMGDVVIDVPPESQLHRQVVHKVAWARAVEMDPGTRLFLVEMAAPDLHAPSGDLERLNAALAAQWGLPPAPPSLPVLARLQAALRKGGWQVTGATGVTGICGSGIIEAVAEMRMAGLLDGSGLIGSAEATGCARITPEGRTHACVLHDARAAGGPLIAVTQGDVRAIQPAKSALYAGARLLMDRFGVDRVDRVVLAGAFGAHVSPLHAMVLGMIPDVPLEKVRSAGSAAGTGARIALCSSAAQRLIEANMRRIEKIETAVEPRFQEHFVAANALPHATDPFPELVCVAPLPEVEFNIGPEGGGRRRRRRGRSRVHTPGADQASGRGHRRQGLTQAGPLATSHKPGRV